MPMLFHGREYDVLDKNRPLDSKMVRILWSFSRDFRGLMILAVLVMLLGAVAELSRPYLLKIAIDEQIAIKDLPGLVHTATIYGWTIIASIGLAFLETILLQHIGQKIIHNVRQKVFRFLIYQRYADLEIQPVGRMVTRVTNDTDAIRDLYTDVLVAFVSDCLVLLGIIAVMLYIEWRLALVAFLVVPFMFLITFVYQRYARLAYRTVREKTANLNTFLQESMTGISIIKAFSRFRRSEEEFRNVSKEYLAAGLREMRTFAVFRPLVDVIYMLAVILVLWQGGFQVQTGGVEIGVIVAFLRYVEKFFWPIKDLAEKYDLLQSALAAAERVYDMLAAERPAEEPTQKHLDCEFLGHIRFQEVWFAYEEENWVLQGVSLDITAGQFVGIVGLSGSGKTTLIGLLLRFYEPQKGIIFLDGVDIREIPLEILRRKIGVVFQDVHLFRGNIAENISMFDETMTHDTIVAAGKMANIHDFVMKLPKGYETDVGYQGGLLSSGQRQLISLARVLACRANVLVLDEATSSIDSETEALVQDALDKAGQERTMLVIAHRLSTIQHAAEIVVLHKGKIKERGTHEALLASNGIYCRLYHSQ